MAYRPCLLAATALLLGFPTEEMAKRAGLAMAMIRLSCDATADANF